MALNSKIALSQARECIRIETEALRLTAKSLGADFVKTAQAVEHTISHRKKLIFSGVGKSADIARKICSTFNSTGVTSCYLDATQALHGDLGLCERGDLAILLSNSGQSEEILKLVPLLKRFQVQIVAFTSNPKSDLALNANYQLLYHFKKEACPLKLAPTASTTAALALGDALAMVILESRNLSRDEFAKYHPAGNLGKVLLLKVKDIMRTGKRLPVRHDTISIQEAILAMTQAKSGCIALVNHKTQKLSGILTDGDFRRCALSGSDFMNKRVSEYMTRKPKCIREEALVVDALRLFETYRIDDLIAVDSRGKPTGIVDGQDLPKFKIV
jgi:arabinose-5-phosphate isomerase